VGEGDPPAGLATPGGEPVRVVTYSWSLARLRRMKRRSPAERERTEWLARVAEKRAAGLALTWTEWFLIGPEARPLDSPK